jgi:RNA 2',3'-cyclic 3'-phosphodiesterase
VTDMRLFTGIAPAAEVAERLAAALDRLRPHADLKWSPVENLHITMKFIGEWPEDRLAELQSALAAIRNGGPFEIAIRCFGFFPNPRRPHALFAGVEAGPELNELAIRIDETVAAHGGKKEDRPYVPHVTLARIKNQRIRELREEIASMTDIDFGAFQATAFHLYQSAEGVYKPLSSYPLVQTA